MPIQVPVTQTGLEKSIQQAAQKAGKNLRINMGPGAKSIESLSRPLGSLTGKTDEFTKSMEAANARVLALIASCRDPSFISSPVHWVLVNGRTRVFLILYIQCTWYQYISRALGPECAQSF
mgnify:CR=1 FL=1